jgi:hypothetical protein
VIDVEEFAQLAGRLRLALEFVENAGPAVELSVRVQQGLHHHGLLWPACVSGLPKRLAIDLKASPLTFTPDSE